MVTIIPIHSYHVAVMGSPMLLDPSSPTNNFSGKQIESQFNWKKPDIQNMTTKAKRTTLVIWKY